MYYALPKPKSPHFDSAADTKRQLVWWWLYLRVGQEEELLLAERERRKSPVAVLVVVLLQPLAVGAQARLQTAVVGNVLSLRRLAVQLCTAGMTSLRNS